VDIMPAAMMRTGLLEPTWRLPRTPAEEHPLIMGAIASLPIGADLSASAPVVLNQGECDGCWAHSATTLKYTREKIKTGGVPILASPLFFMQCMYAEYRKAKFPKGAFPAGYAGALQDQGAQLDDAVRCFTQWGWATFGAVQQQGATDVPATIDARGEPLALPELTTAKLIEGVPRQFGGEYDIAPGASAPRTVAASLAAGIPVWIGALVGQAFQALQAGQVAQPCPRSDPTKGGHAMSILGFRTTAGDELEFLCRNSWGPDWCEGGNCWLSAKFVATAWSLIPFSES
jgi:hypothetical protein